MKIVFLLFPKDEIVIKTSARNDIKIKRFCIRSTDTASVKVHSVYACTIIKNNLSSESL